MATFVQILIAAILSFLGMESEEQHKIADKEGAVIEASMQKHSFLLPAEKIENRKWEFITTGRANCDYDS